ncbi:MAG TPA: lytic transglycosylase domain-containing protein [Vicinamibacterales bacterium]|nr:lytic transglycosylase domain-containing protein [Vicinamibacterales bacterium]
MLRIALSTVLLCVITPALAHAQLYSWTDASGRLIISDRPQSPAARTYSVAYVGAGYGVVNEAPASKRRITEFDDLIVENATQHALHPDFVRAVIQAESAFNPRARSVKGAMGLMQLMPGTAAQYGVTDAFDPVQNVKAGVAYLKSLLVRFGNDISLALAAYNAGPKAVERYGNAVPPYKETRNYVSKIRANAGAAAESGPKPIVRRVEIVNGREVVRYSQK